MANGLLATPLLSLIVLQIFVGVLFIAGTAAAAAFPARFPSGTPRRLPRTLAFFAQALAAFSTLALVLFEWLARSSRVLSLLNFAFLSSFIVIGLLVVATLIAAYVQDLWIARTGSADAERRTYGTTIRVWDPEISAWRVRWINPPHNRTDELIGRRVGDDVVQTGYFGDTPAKWTFTDVTPDAFIWRGYLLDADGVTWRLGTEFKLRRL
jgi:hypothetical protein